MAFTIHSNMNQNIVCVFAEGPKLTQFLGIVGCQLSVCELPNHEFKREYGWYPKDKTPLDFANTWTRSDDSIRMIPISPGACTVLRAILQGRTVENPLDGYAAHNLNRLEHHMAKKQAEAPVVADGEFRKPDGPVAQIHAYLDKNLERIQKGDVTRKELITELTETKKQFALGTVQTQLGRWAQLNAIQFRAIEPSPAAVKRAEKAKKEAAAATA